MRILNLSLDKNILKQDSFPARRIKKYGNLVDKYFVVVPTSQNISLDLSSRVRVYGIKGKYKLFAFFSIFKKAWQIIKKYKINIISIQDPYYLAILGLILARVFNLGLEIQVHGFEKFTFLRKIVARLVLPHANSVRTVSQRLKNFLRDEFGIREDKITVVPVYFKKTNNNRIGLKQIKKDKFIFLTIGRLVPVKNIDLQIKALKNVIKTSNKQIELWIVGSGPEKIRLEKLVNELNLKKQVVFFGWRDSLDNFYRQANVFLLTSNSEGWGMVILEAASYGLPIIMTRVGCADEFIIHKKNGIIITPDNQKELEQAMIKLLNNKKLRFELGNAAFKSFKNLPSEEEILNLYKESWQKALTL